MVLEATAYLALRESWRMLRDQNWTAYVIRLVGLKFKNCIVTWEGMLCIMSIAEYANLISKLDMYVLDRVEEQIADPAEQRWLNRELLSIRHQMAEILTISQFLCI